MDIFSEQNESKQSHNESWRPCQQGRRNDVSHDPCEEESNQVKQWKVKSSSISIPSNAFIPCSHAGHSLEGSFRRACSNVTDPIFSHESPAKSEQASVYRRRKEYKSDLWNDNTQITVGDHFFLQGHSATDLKVVVVEQINFTARLKEEAAEMTLHWEVLLYH